MKQRKIIHPRKIVKFMEKFVNEVHQPTYSVIQLKPIENESTEAFLRWFEEAEEIKRPGFFKMVKASGFLAFTSTKDDECWKIGYNIEDLYCGGSKQFRQHFVNLCPAGKGFANITIILLHEIGHFVSQQEFEGYNRHTEILKLRNKYDEQTINWEYFKLLDEASATNWAIEWLQNKENRVLAKAFEKKFFSCLQ